MGGFLVVPSIDSRMESLEIVLKLLDNYGRPISQNHLAEKLKQEQNFKSIKNIHSLMRKTELSRYFGLAYKDDKVILTERGKRYLEADDNKKIDIIFESLRNDTFGRNNNGIQNTNSKVEAPNVFLRAINDLRCISTDEFAAILYLMNNLDKTYEESLKRIYDYRINNNLEILINEIKEKNFYRKYGSNNKIRGFFENIKIVSIYDNNYFFSEYIKNNYINDIQQLKVVNTGYSSFKDIPNRIDTLCQIEGGEKNKNNKQGYRFYLKEYELDISKKNNDIVSEDEEKYNSQKLIDWSPIEGKNEERKFRHRKLNDEVHKLLKDRGFRIFEGNIDCLAFKDSTPILINEIKTLSGEEKDEKAQVLKAFSQLYYYEMFAMKQFEGYKSQKIAIFEGKISDEHINFLEYNNIYVLWKNDDGILSCSNYSLEFFKELNIVIEI